MRQCNVLIAWLVILGGCLDTRDSGSPPSAPAAPQPAEETSGSARGRYLEEVLSPIHAPPEKYPLLVIPRGDRLRNVEVQMVASWNAPTLITADNFPELLERAEIFPLDDPRMKQWSYSSWVDVWFEADGQVYQAAIFLGGMGWLSKPDGATCGLLLRFTPREENGER